MLLIIAILRVWLPVDIERNELLARTRLRVGYVSLSVIALIFLLSSFWQHSLPGS